MHPPHDQRPQDPHRPTRLRLEHMPELRADAVRACLETVNTVEPGRRVEAEDDPPTRFVVLDDVANVPVTSVGSDLQWAVEAHGRPPIAGPQSVLVGAQRVKEPPDVVGSRGQPS